jgi:hypothetical protein
MAIHNKYYSVQATTNTVSADRTADERSFRNIVFQSGKPPIDFEFNLDQDVILSIQDALRSESVPSGFLKGVNRKDLFSDYSFDLPADPTFLANSFRMDRSVAYVAGFPITLEYTNITTAGDNRIQLTAPPILGGAPPDVKRTDFVFLEVWQSLVAPSPRAVGSYLIDTIPAPGDILTINGNPLTAMAGAPGVDQFQVGGTEIATATNIAAAINDPANSFLVDVYANSYGTDTVHIFASSGGVAGNAITIVSSVPLVMVPSGATLVGGADRPNKPDQMHLYRHGNTQAPLAVCPVDDLMDTTIAEETALRVQVNYRIRVTGSAEAVNFKIEPDGFSNAVIMAQGGMAAPVATYPFVPADKATVNANSSALAYGIEDSGLWVAGDGTSAAATALQTLDGYVYAIPICFVFRRNDAEAAALGFDPETNSNGGLSSTHAGFAHPILGVIPAGRSDRPDNYLSDTITSTDVLDLRRHVSLSGLDLKSELNYQIKSLMDGSYKTWAIDTASKQDLGAGSGDVSTQNLVCNEIGRAAGVPPSAGDTTRGVSIRDFDHLARRFGSAPVVEKVVFALYPQDRNVGPVVPPGTIDPGKYVVKAAADVANTGWFEGDVIHINLATLNASTLGSWDPATASTIGVVTDYLPTGTKVSDVISVYHDDGDWNAAVDQTVRIRNIQGLGTSHIIITLDLNDETTASGGLNVATYPMVSSAPLGPQGSPRRIFVELELTYPIGVGLTDTPTIELTPDSVVYAQGPIIENDTTQRPVDLENVLAPGFRPSYREVKVEYLASENGAGAPIGSLVPESFVSRNANDVIFLRRVFGGALALVTVTDAESALPRGVNIGLSEYGSSSRKIVLSDALSGAGHTLCNVTYFAQDAVPNYGALGYQVSIYYRTNAPQTAGVKEGVMHGAGGPMPNPVVVEPLAFNDLWTGQTSVGSNDLAFPYALPLEQIPVNDNATATYPGEWFFCGTSQIDLDNFDCNTGLLNLHPVVQSDETVQFTFGSGALPPIRDMDFRAFYGYADNTAYRPTVFSQPLYYEGRRKVFVPFLARAVSDNLLFRKNEVLLVVLSRWAEMDKDNVVVFSDTDNRTCAAIYRTKNLLVVAGS